MLDVSRIDIPPPFSALQLLNVVDAVMESVDELESEAEIAPPLLDAEEEVNEQPVMVSVTSEEYITEIAPPSPSLQEQLANVIPESVRFESSDANSNTDPFPFCRVISQNRTPRHPEKNVLRGVNERIGYESNVTLDILTSLRSRLPFPILIKLYVRITETEDSILTLLILTLPVEFTNTIPYPLVFEITIPI